MNEQCICINSPDAVDKINWKCVECKRDLKTDIARVTTEKELAAVEAEKIVLEANAGGLTDEQIKARRDLGNE